MSAQERNPGGGLPLSATLRGFMADWQPRQRITAGLLAALFDALGALRRAHPEWVDYDLNTHLLGALHLAIENNRLTGTRTLSELVAELATLCALECPDDPAQKHTDIAEAIFGVLMNSRDRETRFRDRYLSLDDGGRVEHPEQTFAFLHAVGGDDTTDPRVKVTPEGVNIFQNLHDFDPFDRAAAERYRSERMLKRGDYEEVAASVQRRATSIHAVQASLDRLLRRMSSNVRDVTYAKDVIPQVDEALVLIGEQIGAEEKLAAGIDEHMHHRAPDVARLQRITEHLNELLRALSRLYSMLLTVKETYEQEQDRQLFTFRRLTINPQTDLFEPLLRYPPPAVVSLLEQRLATLLGPRVPQVLNMQAVINRTQPQERSPGTGEDSDPFDLGESRDENADDTMLIVAEVTAILAEITTPTSLSQLNTAAADRPMPALSADQRARVPWALAVAVAGAYGGNDPAESDAPQVFDHTRFGVVRPGTPLETTAVTGDDLIVVPLTALDKENSS
ncbi:hypothetical protein ACIG87_26075 [Micromonospora sp. NPDC051925]|uniref:hypothetical protein n=1 Tax=Micromonospora sp. NPDC051925 TaxID=3364288 RepID=UPI0037C53506